jgi:hypothetical protein
MGDFIELIKEGFRLAANVGKLALDATMVAVDAIKAAIFAYFKQVKKWTIRLTIAAFAPLVLIVPCLIFHAPLRGLYGLYVVWVVLLVVAELILVTPVFLVWRRVKSIPILSTVARDLEDWFSFINSIAFNGLSLVIFVTLVPIWRSPGAFVLLLIVMISWLTLPACSVSSICRRIYPTVSVIQLLGLSGLLFLQIAFPRQIEQLGWATHRTLGNVITSSVKQKEITSEWNTLQWFDNVGESQVWYSGSAATGFRLWAAPGFDPESGKELRPIGDEKTRVQIVTFFSEKERRQREITAAEQTEIARKEAARRREEQDRLEKERALAAQSYLTRYLGTREVRKAGDKQTLAVVAVSENGKLNTNVGQVIAEVLKTESVEVTTSRFTPEFVSDGLFAQAFGNSRAILNKLELTNSLGALLLARQTVQYSTNASLENVITANMRLEVLGMAVADSGAGRTLSITASGVGFKPEDARSQAEERLSKKIQGEADSFRNATRPNSQ